MAKTYGSAELGGTVTVDAETGAISSAFNSAVAIVGGYDAGNADPSVTAGEVHNVTSGPQASRLFGSDSELRYACSTAIANGASEVKAVPVPETTGTTESFTSTQSITLSESPIFDPNVNPEHSITVTDTVGSTDFTNVYDYSSPPSTPAGPDEAAINPVTGEIETSESTDFDVTYDHGDYTSAIATAVDENVRFVIVLTENDSVESTLLSELSSHETDFDFKRGVVGERPGIDSGDLSTHTPSSDSDRIVTTVNPRAMVDSSTEARTLGAIGGSLAGNPLGDAFYYESINGFTSMKTDYTGSEAADATRAVAITENFEVISSVTTSTESAFSDVFQVEIIDEVAYLLHLLSKDYRGEGVFDEQIEALESRAGNILSEMANDRPPLLATGDGGQPYTVNASTGTSDTEIELDVNIEPLDIAKQVNVAIGVGEVVTYDGASA